MAEKRVYNRSSKEARYLFDQHYEVDLQTECWHWTGGKNNIGYGMFRYDGKMRTAHRVIMQLEGHDIEGKTVYRTCDHYDCVNPAHLRVGTTVDKAREMAIKGHAGHHLKDPSKFRTCKYCGTVANSAVIGHFHNEKCKHKP